MSTSAASMSFEQIARAAGFTDDDGVIQRVSEGGLQMPGSWEAAATLVGQDRKLVAQALPVPSKYRTGDEDNPLHLELDQLALLGVAKITSLGEENVYVEKGGRHYYCKVHFTERFAEGVWNFEAYPEGADEPDKLVLSFPEDRKVAQKMSEADFLGLIREFQIADNECKTSDNSDPAASVQRAENLRMQLEAAPYVLTEGKVTRKVAEDELEIRKVLVLSTRHLSRQTCQSYGDWPVISSHDHGLYAYVGDEPELYSDAPEDLQRVLAFAKKHGCTEVKFDCDGNQVTALPVYDRDASHEPVSTVNDSPSPM